MGEDQVPRSGRDDLSHVSEALAAIAGAQSPRELENILSGALQSLTGTRMPCVIEGGTIHVPAPIPTGSEASLHDSAVLLVRVATSALERIARAPGGRLTGPMAERHVRTLFEHSSDVFWSADSEGKLTYVSDRFQELTGLPVDVVLDQDWLLPIHPDDRDSLHGAWTQSLTTGQALDAEYRLKTLTGSYLWMRSRAVPERDAAGNIAGWYGVASDIDRRRSAEEALRRSERGLRTVIDANPIGVVMAELDSGRVIDANQAFLRILGVTREELIGSSVNWQSFTPPEWLAVDREQVERARATSGVAQYEKEYQRRDGTRVPVHVGFSIVDESKSQAAAFVLDLTELRRTQTQLRRNQARHSALLEAISSVVWVCDGDGNFVEPQPLWESYTGQRWESQRGAGWREMFHSDDRPALESGWSTSPSGVGAFHLQGRLWHAPSGAFRHVVGRAVPMRDSSGQVYEWVCSIEDVEEQWLAENALRQSEAQYRQIAEGLPQLVWGTTPDGSHDFLNRRWHEYTGLHSAQDPNWLHAVSSEDREGVANAWQHSIQSGEPFEAEFRMCRSDGQLRWVLSRAVPIRDEHGQIVRWFGTGTEIHEQKEIERALRLANEVGASLAADLDLDRIVQQLTDAGTEAIGAEFGAFFYNVTDPEGESYLLYTLSGAPREAFEGFGMPRATPIFAPTFGGERIVRSDDITQDPLYGEWSPHHGMPSGHLPVRSYLAVPVISRSGEVIGGLFFGHHSTAVFTEAHEKLVSSFASQAAVSMDNARLYRQVREMNTLLERRVRERTAELEAANRELEGFTYAVAHDLRAPLRSLMATAAIVLEEAPDTLDPELRRLLHRQSYNASYLARLIDDLLAYARLSRMEVRRERVDLTRLAQEVADSLPFRGRIEVEENLNAFADPALLKLLLENLLSNAVKFSPRGGTITVGRGSSGEFFVADQGVGFDMAHASRLFEPFERLVRADEFPGTGIGLANVKRIVERHHGDLRATATPGHGATFHFTIGE